MLQLPEIKDLDEVVELAKAVADDDFTGTEALDASELADPVGVMAETILVFRGFIEDIHRMMVDDGISGADFFMYVAEAFEAAGMKESWRGYVMDKAPR